MRRTRPIPPSDSLVTLVYNVQDENYYDCAEDSYTAGYFAPDYIDSVGMNVIVLDAFDWTNRVGEDPNTAAWSDQDASNDRPELYEGVIAHELEHLLMNYSDPGELSWVDEGLADVAAFLNGYDMTGSHLTYQQVFHRETSLTRWGGGLENYGASFSYFAYLWEQAGGNGDGDLIPDQVYDGVAAVTCSSSASSRSRPTAWTASRTPSTTYNAQNGTPPTCDRLRSCSRTGRSRCTSTTRTRPAGTWRTSTSARPRAAGPSTSPTTSSGTTAATTRAPSRARSGTGRATARTATALPFGVSYEKFRNPGPRVSLDFAGDAETAVAPHSGATHWWGGYTSQSDTILGLDTPVAAGETVNFWNWHFIEDGWDYGFVEALVDGEWVTLPVTDVAHRRRSSPPTRTRTAATPRATASPARPAVSTSSTSRSTVQYAVTVPAGAPDVRWRYSTDAAYLDTGWFIDDVTVGAATALSVDSDGNWVETTASRTTTGRSRSSRPAT